MIDDGSGVVDKNKPNFEQIVVASVLRLDAMAQGVVTGIVAGLVLFVATNYLILQGGNEGATGEVVVGPHLLLLSQFFIGYKMTFVGSVIGFGYATVCGFVIGFCFAGMYNWFVSLREHKFQNRAQRSVRLREMKYAPDIGKELRV
jgi:hypothetical protein